MMKKNISPKKLRIIDPYQNIESISLKFSIQCMNTGRSYSYNLEDLDKKYTLISQAFSIGILLKRHSVGHLSREKSISVIRKFYQYLDALPIDSQPYRPNQIDVAFLRTYATWLKKSGSGNYNSKSITFRALCGIIKPWIGRCWSSKDLAIPTAQFPRASSTATPHQPFQKVEMEQIITAVHDDLAIASTTIEIPYIRKYTDQPAPLFDVAPFDERRPNSQQHNKWESEEYRIWWWENKCDCQRLYIEELSKITQGSTFIGSLFLPSKGSMKNSKIKLDQFYERIGAGDSYVPKYLGKDSPIKYTTRWKKIEYLHWYWENHCDCKIMLYAEMKKCFPEFITAIREYHSGLPYFYDFVGVKHFMTAHDYMPYYIALLISTALNPSTIQKLKINCLDTPTFDNEQEAITWEKLRASKRSSTIPTNKTNGFSPPSIIRRILNISKPFRDSGLDEVNFLFITNSANSGSKKGYALTKTVFARALRNWFSTHNLKYRDDSTTLISTALSAGAVRFRPTILSSEYHRTGNLNYVQNLAAHSNAELTSSYIRRTGNQDLQFRRGIHLQALFIELTTNRNDALKFIQQHGVSKSDAREILNGDKNKTAVATCLSPKDSPIKNQKKGVVCNAQDVCFHCSNLVVTYDDLVRNFAFIAFHEDLLNRKAITESEYGNACLDRKHWFENYVISRFSDSTVSRAKFDAKNSPPIEWRI